MPKSALALDLRKKYPASNYTSRIPGIGDYKKKRLLCPIKKIKWAVVRLRRTGLIHDVDGFLCIKGG